MNYSIWIELEACANKQWDVKNDNTDVIVEFEDGTRWIATFITYANMQLLIDKNKETGECLSGKYFWASDMLLVDEVSRSRIEEIVHHLNRQGEFEVIFSKCIDD